MVFIQNFRGKDLAKFLWKYRVGVISVIKKITLKSESIASLYEKPFDYDDLLLSHKTNEVNYLKTSFENWKEYQIKELKRFKLMSET